ncbi:uncharacterized protein LOC143147413 [Ptiloglossa arizonensis]|uniref:uncharacterized protein LOC143147413 n=1 Tax=Ptiloglossa arizonensis TaxID=3350558 RepID=UPI003F9F54B0
MAVGVLSVEIPTVCPPNGNPVSGAVHIAHETDCTKFYKYFMGKKYEIDCALDVNGDRLYFNPETQVCDWRWNVTCNNVPDPECVSSHDGFVWSHTFDCSLYYRCDKGKKRLVRCDKGSLFDPERLSCKPEEDVNCDKPLNNNECTSDTNGVLFPHECNCHEYYKCSNGELILKVCNSVELFDHNLGKCVPSEKAVCNSTRPSNTVCPATGTVRLPHKRNCSLYYNCKDGVKTVQRCTTGLFFDEIMGMCAWWKDVDCGSRSTRQTSPTENAASTIDEIYTPESSNEILRLPHPCVCNLYYRFVDGVTYRRFCPEGQEFDYIHQVCGEPETVHCVRPIPPPMTPKSTYSPSTTPKSTYTSSTTSKFTYSLSTTTNRPDYTGFPIGRVCPSWGTVKYPHEYDCSRYYECKNGVKELAKCLEGHYFNDLLQICDLPRNTNCTTGHGNECPISDCTTLLPDTESCSHYYRCVNGYKTRMSCSPGLLYNVNKQMCDLPQYVDCNQTKCPVGDTTYHPCNCHLYYECNEYGKKELKRCRDNLLYDYILKKCVERQYAHCWSNKEICVPGEARHHECQCNQYYRCSEDGQKEFLEYCDSNLLFDCDTLKCVSPDMNPKCCKDTTSLM